MKNIITLILGIFISYSSLCQDSSKFVDIPEIDAEFTYKNCMNTGECIKQFVNDNAVWPSQDDVMMTIFVECIVDIDGSLKELKIKRGGSSEFNEASLDIVRKMPNWKPAKHQGKIVKTRVYIPIRWE